MPSYLILNGRDQVVHKFDAPDAAAAQVVQDSMCTADMAEYTLAVRLQTRKARTTLQRDVVAAPLSRGS